MIKRFNFYDIYGFLIPGSALVAGLWLPYALIECKWPDRELASLAAALALGYVSGHILQVLANKALPSKIHVAKGAWRHLSDIFLDDDDETFSQTFKDKLAAKIETELAIDVKEKKENEKEDRTTRRLDAFLLCRASVMQSGRLSYAEQFEGLYALSRGLAAAFFLNALYHYGWGLAKCWRATPRQSGWVIGISAGLAFLALLLTYMSPSTAKLKRFENIYWSVVPLASGLMALGHYLGVRKNEDGFSSIFLLLASGELLVTVACLLNYRRFREEFAKTVYREFAVLTENNRSN